MGASSGSICRPLAPKAARSALKSARALPSRWRCATSTSRVLRRASMAVRAVVVRPRLAASSIVESIWPSWVEVGNGVGRNLDPGGKSRVLHLDRRCSRTMVSYMGGDELSINASRIDDGKAGDEHSEGKAPDQDRHAPSPGERSYGHQLGPFHRERHDDNGQRGAWDSTTMPLIEKKAAAPARTIAAT